MAGEYDVNYLESWQGYEQPTDKTVQELEAEMQKALANAAQLSAEQQNGMVYMDEDGRLIIPVHSIIGWLHIRDATINSANIAVAAIGTAHIQDANITRAKIQHAAIGTAEIADASIITAKIENATITTAKIANAAITTALIDTGAIGTAQIANGSITDAKIVDLSAGKITAGTIDTGQVNIQGPSGRLRITGNRVQVFDNSAVPKERVSMGDVLGNGTVYGFLMRAADGLTTMIDTTGVKSAGITDGAITNPKIGEGAVMNNNIYANTITGNKLIAEAITTREIAAQSITANKIVTGSITSASGAIGDISANNIKTGTLEGATIRGANIYGTYIEGGTIAGTTITGTSLVGGSITSSNSASSFSLTAGEALFYNSLNGSFIKMGPAGLNGVNVTPEKISLYALNSVFVETEAVRTTNKNTYLVTKWGSAASTAWGEVRIVKDIGVPGDGQINSYEYADLRCGNIMSNGYQVITTGNAWEHIRVPDVSNFLYTWDARTLYWPRSYELVSNQPYLRMYAGEGSWSMLELGTDGMGRYMQHGGTADRYYTGTVNGYITASGTFGRIGSSQKLKLNIADLEDEKVYDILKLRPRTWHDKGVVEEAAQYMNEITPFDQDGNEAIYVAPPTKNNDIRAIERIVGFVAEEVDALGLTEYVVYSPYDEEGNRKIESVMYDRMWIPLVPIIRELVESVKQIKEVLGISA